jgi:hypothetical protein
MRRDDRRDHDETCHVWAGHNKVKEEGDMKYDLGFVYPFS